MSDQAASAAAAEASPDVPDLIAPPPLLLAAAFGAGLILDRLLPLRFASRTERLALGGVLAGGGLALGGWAFRTMVRHGTNVDPREPATTVVTDGPFRYTRNPIYTGMASLYTGLSLLLNRPMALLLLPLLLRLLNHGVIDREERYLARKFGDAYNQYRAHVPRWL